MESYISCPIHFRGIRYSCKYNVIHRVITVYYWIANVDTPFMFDLQEVKNKWKMTSVQRFGYKMIHEQLFAQLLANQVLTWHYLKAKQ